MNEKRYIWFLTEKDAMSSGQQHQQQQQQQQLQKQPVQNELTFLFKSPFEKLIYAKF